VSTAFEILTEPVSDADLGRAVETALEAFQEDVLLPDRDSGSPLLEALGLRSWGAYEKGAVSVEVCAWEGQLRCTPSENRGKGGFVDRPGAAEDVPCGASQAELGRAGRRALAASV
jgi:hypothetical protein